MRDCSSSFVLLALVKLTAHLESAIMI
ncbi:hypothetical protein CHELA40_14321 [Chelatococcus asaccharovorans]|nr:hypothetical protein CHELA17_61300 [Chelatococcus asaccharovorans]CAH1676718.1 hypothetical protein CHELA40_14321 [Chelatococcus asaccharovorans]